MLRLKRCFHSVNGTASTVSFPQSTKKRRLDSQCQHVSTIVSNEERSVKFSNDSEVHEIEDTSDLSVEEMKAIYMCDDDQKRIYLEIAETIRKVAEATVDKKRLIAEGIRGLEGILQPRKGGRANRMRNAMVAVLDRQLTHDITESWLTNEYRPLLEESKKLARDRALLDEAEAMKVLDSLPTFRAFKPATAQQPTKTK